MEHIPHTALAEAVGAAAEQGSGPLLRVVLVLLLVGAALMAWFLLRGYRGAGDSEEDGRTSGEADSAAPGSGEHHPEEHGGRRNPS